MSSVVSPFGRASFPELEQPTQINGQGDKMYRLTIMIPADDPGIQTLKQQAAAAVKKKWPNEIPEQLTSPFIDGDTTGRPEYAGHTIIRMKSKNKPQIVDHRKQPILASDIYSGCNIRVSMNAYAWVYMGKNGVSFGLGHVQKIDDKGEPLDGRGSADTVFDVVESGGGTGAASFDDEIPF